MWWCAEVKKNKNKELIVNIKSTPIQGHVGASKFSNDDWGTISFVIPRNQLQSRFYDSELRYNSIYLLFGYSGPDELVYVGQAKKRNNGESVLCRLREHDASKVESYNDKWEWAVVLTNKEDAWDLGDLNALENILYNEIPKGQCLNGNNPNFGGADLDNYSDKINQIKSLVTSIGFRIFYKESYDSKSLQVTPGVNEYTTVEDLQNGSARIPEIVTPQKVVSSMIDSLPSSVWNSKTRFLDIACKGGEFLREIYDRLMDNEEIQSEFPNMIERSNHILKNQIFGIALSKVSLERTTKKLLGEDRNIKILDDYVKCIKKGNSKDIKDLINKEFNSDMEFDVVIGNPPYQETTGGGKGGGGNTLYDKFVIVGCDIASRVVSFVVPARWYTSETRAKEMRAKILENNNVVELHDFPNTEDLFKGVWIMGGVCYFLIDKNFDGMCKFVEHRDGKIFESRRYLKNKYTDFIIRNASAVGIVEKVLDRKEEKLYTYIREYSPFKIRSYERGNLIRLSDDQVELYYTGNENKGGGIGYLNREDVPSGRDLIDRHKIFINSVSDNMLNFPYRVLYKAFYGAPGTVCTESYLCIGPIKGKEYAEPIIKYLETKFVKALVLQCKTSQTSYARVYRLVPLQNFEIDSDINWKADVQDIDRQLYRKYGFTDDEIQYIENYIKL